jgi:hypothetical protein
MMAQRVVGVRVEPVATETGLWCSRCLLPSGILVWLAISLGDQMHLQRMRRCRECGSGMFVTYCED